jgi:hypothetical protein
LFTLAVSAKNRNGQRRFSLGCWRIWIPDAFVLQGCIKLQEPRDVGVAETSNLPAPLRLLHAADWKSAIQQSGTLRYFPGLMQPWFVLRAGVLELCNPLRFV